MITAAVTSHDFSFILSFHFVTLCVVPSAGVAAFGSRSIMDRLTACHER
jgi:hypothetical protein